MHLAAATSLEAPAGWTRRFLVRTGGIYVVLWWAFSMLGLFLVPRALLLDALAVKVFHLGPLSFAPTGSLDRLFDWAGVALDLALASVAACIWTAISPRREHPRLAGWVRILLRYTLAAIMLQYGFEKVFPSQFVAPGADRLGEPLGALSPMALLWTFMGSSTAYSVFGGLGEVVGAALLLFRRTTTLGALLLCGVLANVVMLNFAYDVPVKQFSSHLLLIAIWLAAPALPSVWSSLREAADRIPTPWSDRGERWIRWVHPVIALALVGLMGLTAHAQYAALARDAQSPLVGSWKVQAARGVGWEALGVGESGLAHVRMQDGTWQWYHVRPDRSRTALDFSGMRGTQGRFSLRVRTAPSGLVLDSEPGAAQVHVELERAPSPPRVLLERGFHWVNPFPYQP